MKAVIQRVSNARVIVGEQQIAQIDKGMLVLLGVKKEDTQQETELLAKKRQICGSLMMKMGK